MPPLAPLLPKRSTILTALDQPHTPYYSSTFLRFYKFTENNKLPINSPIEAYHKPITHHQPFPPNALHSPILILTHCTIQPLCLHWHLFSPSAPQSSQPLINHTHAITVPRFYDFTNSQKTTNFR